MPVPLIAAIATIAAAGTTTGLAIDSALNQPGSPKIPTTPSPMTTTQNAQTTSAVGQQLPNLQSLTGGSVSPEYASQFGATQTGVANNPQAGGDVQAAINQFFGLSAPGSTGITASGSSPTSGGPGILDLLTKSGTSPSPATTGGGGGGSDFVSSLLSSDTFRGLAG
jgi:hypothetical protein